MYSVKHKKEKQRAAMKRWYLKHRDRIVALRNSPEKKALRRKSTKARRHKRRLEILNFLGGKCVRCGLLDWRALQIDHVNGGGSKERKEFRLDQLLTYQRHVMKNQGKYQILCANCNWIKRYEEYEERIIVYKP